jgi:hypothetical protein
MASEKENVMQMIKDLPDDVTLDEIMYHLYVKQKIIRGLEDIRQGKTYTHDEVREMARKWVKSFQKSKKRA